MTGSRDASEPYTHPLGTGLFTLRQSTVAYHVGQVKGGTLDIEKILWGFFILESVAYRGVQ